ncbi:MAG: altronate hydrolase [Candidatus Lokiarchaeota archaeon]|nr:altronate hydrolase [Candidatus Lokiarchaeota archaeon]
MHQEDNCATTLEDLEENEELELENRKIKLNHNIPLGHKFALENINKSDLIKKYGEIIGIATEDIKIGDWIHTHNIISHYLKEVLNL